jgi:hypothetical protein
MFGKRAKKKHKPRYLRPEQFDALLAELPPHLKLAAQFAVLADRAPQGFGLPWPSRSLSGTTSSRVAGSGVCAKPEGVLSRGSEYSSRGIESCSRCSGSCNVPCLVSAMSQLLLL